MSGPGARTLEIHEGGRAVATIPSGRRNGTWAIALSEDARTLFLGGYFEGVLYDISNPADPQQIASIPANAFIGNASFASGGNLLLTVEYEPPSYYNRFHVTPIDGAPMERLACSIGAGALQGTLATRVLDGDALRPCE